MKTSLKLHLLCSALVLVLALYTVCGFLSVLFATRLLLNADSALDVAVALAAYGFVMGWTAYLFCDNTLPAGVRTVLDWMREITYTYRRKEWRPLWSVEIIEEGDECCCTEILEHHANDDIDYFQRPSMYGGWVNVRGLEGRKVSSIRGLVIRRRIPQS